MNKVGATPIMSKYELVLMISIMSMSKIKMLSFKIVVIIFLLALFNCAGASENQHTSQKVQAAPDPGSVNQPDGTVIIIYLRGDEWCNWIENELGYSIDKAVDKWWYYVSNGEGTGPEPMNSESGVKLTNVYAHEPPPVDLPQHIKPVYAREKEDEVSPSK